MNLQSILTERRNPATEQIDQLSTLEIVQLINDEDQKVPQVIAGILPTIATVVDKIVEQLKKGGRLIYVGAGTSGRLGILDASECPPTYSTPPEQIVAVIAGGAKAIQTAQEGVEDRPAEGQAAMVELDVSANDIVIGIAASGRTPYTVGAMEEAKARGAVVAAVVCTPHSAMEQVAHYTMKAEVGPEVITGSTRMKAGTAQKLILNTLTTTAMVRIGKVYSNLMVDLTATNEKLRLRARTIVAEAAGVSLEEAERALAAYGSAKPAILSLVTGLTGEQVTQLLAEHDGYLRQAIAEAVRGDE